MSGYVELSSPFGEEAALRALRAGDRVRLSGRVYTGRDRFHKFLGEGGVSPVELRGAAIFHCGPVVLREGAGWRVVAAGPTTSIREEPYMGGIIRRHGVRVILGKGGMGAGTLEACRECGCVYLQAVGGAAALTARHITAVKDVHFLDEFGPTEAVWTLQVDGLEAIVGMDTHGESLFDRVRAASEKRLLNLLHLNFPQRNP